MPTTAPSASTSGPPEFPGLIAASVWTRPSKMPSGPGRLRSMALTTPRLTERSNRSGLPIATTSWPTTSLPPARGRPRRPAQAGMEASTRSTARSVRASLPTRSAGTVSPPGSRTRMPPAPAVRRPGRSDRPGRLGPERPAPEPASAAAPATTWALVST
jgi:hypothetical protein